MEVSAQILSEVVVWSKYARYLPEESRRESWQELVTRNKEMHLRKFPFLKDEIEDSYRFVYERKVLPSMRALQFSGKPIEINATRQYNCSFLPIDDPAAFWELMFLLLSGCGVGFSVQRHHIARLPHIHKPHRSRRFLVGDSIEGWADAVKVLVRSYFEDRPLPVFDFSDIRPKGSPLKTSGGKAPGPGPLRDCLQKINNILSCKEAGSKLSPLDAHDICCLIADAVLAGGIRRSATISLFDLDDEEMLTCKSNLVPEGVITEGPRTGNGISLYVDYRGDRIPVTLSIKEHEEFSSSGKLRWYHLAPYRARANNSAVILRHKIDEDTFFDFWDKVRASGSGEPGFLLSNDKNLGTNPCGEISLKPFQFCNLVTINVSDVETQEELETRAKAAAFIATLQASYTDFHYLRDEWKATTEKDALIGVSMTGIASGSVLKLDLETAAKSVRSENVRVAKLIGINPAARATTVKPEGTSSLVLGTSSGIHPWHAQYYYRRMRVGKNEAIYTYFHIYHPELVEDDYFQPGQQAIIKVPLKAPSGAITREESAIDLLNRIGDVYKRWIVPGHRKGSNKNNVSATVTVAEDEWDKVGSWMWEHRNEYTALSILPEDLGTYKQPPFEEISKEEYERAFALLSSIDLSQVIEVQDDTKRAEEVACGGGTCELT